MTTETTTTAATTTTPDTTTTTTAATTATETTGSALSGAAGDPPNTEATTTATSTAPKGDEGKAGDEAAAAAAKAAADAAAAAAEVKPIEYTDFKVPEGQVIDKATLDTVVPILKDLNIPQEGAQKLVDAYAAVKAKEADAWVAQVGKWGNETKADKEISGGAGYDANVQTAQAAIRDLFPDVAERTSFVTLLEQNGLANHPLMVKMCLRAGQQFADDKIVRATDASRGPRSLADRMYPAHAKP